MQSCPKVSSAMHQLLSIVQTQCGAWVGLSVVHLGDRDVPNAFMFIDKVCFGLLMMSVFALVVYDCAQLCSLTKCMQYTQVPRILGPIGQWQITSPTRACLTVTCSASH